MKILKTIVTVMGWGAILTILAFGQARDLDPKGPHYPSYYRAAAVQTTDPNPGYSLEPSGAGTFTGSTTFSVTGSGNHPYNYVFQMWASGGLGQQGVTPVGSPGGAYPTNSEIATELAAQFNKTPGNGHAVASGADITVTADPPSPPPGQGW